MADGSFDDLLLGLAQRHKGIEDLLYSILSFFERRTDFFHIMEGPEGKMGFQPGVAEKMLLKQFRHFQYRYLERAQPHLLKKEAQEAAPASTASANAAIQDSKPQVPEAAASVAAMSSAATPSAPSAPPSTAKKGQDIPNGVDASPQDGGPGASQERTEKVMRHISTWNGAATEKYYWTQSIHEVTLEVEVESGTKARDLKVDLTSTRLSIKARGKLILEGKLHEKINTEDSVWHLDENKLVISMEKQRQTWWKCVLEGDEEIDTSKVESVRRMDEYDGETQGAIRKIMFDQNQKIQGKATSDQLRTAEMMKDAWNAPNSPFRGTEFDPSMINLSSPVPDDFFQGVEQKRIEEATKRKEEEEQAGTGST
mmetsp:Transcript_51828/g.116870  ORF Transcript_51828/g.116870 Transcript_51828/m.116870 type:complete len:369 (+) Transcript_51828:119-1225(+)